MIESETGTWYYNSVVSLFIEGEHYEQEIIDRRPTIMQGNSCPFYNLFHGIVYCATCGKSMQVRYEKKGRTGKNRFIGEEREPVDKAYYI